MQTRRFKFRKDGMQTTVVAVYEHGSWFLHCDDWGLHPRYYVCAHRKGRYDWWCLDIGENRMGDRNNPSFPNLREAALRRSIYERKK